MPSSAYYREQLRARDLDEHISCSLCKEFLRDAVTLNGCLHFFCRACLLRHLSSLSPEDQRCPRCFVPLMGSQQPVFRSDPALQELVYKLVPDLFWRQLRRIARNRRSSSSTSSSNSSPSSADKQSLLLLSSSLCSPNEKISLQLDFVPLSTVLAVNGAAAPDGATSSSFDSSSSSSAALTGTTNSEHNHAAISKSNSFRRFFRCPAGVRIAHLKRLLELKLAMTDCYGVYFVDSELRNLLEDDFSLQDIIHLYNWSREGPLPIRFTLARLPQEEEDRPPLLEEMPQLDVESGPMERVEPVLLEEKGGNQQSAAQNESPKAAETDEPHLEKSSNSPEGGEAGDGADSILPPAKAATAAESPPSTSSSAAGMPRLSTAGVSPLRPVPSSASALLSTLGASEEPPAKKFKNVTGGQQTAPVKRNLTSNTAAAAGLSGGGGKANQKQQQEVERQKVEKGPSKQEPKKSGEEQGKDQPKPAAIPGTVDGGDKGKETQQQKQVEGGLARKGTETAGVGPTPQRQQQKPQSTPKQAPKKQQQQKSAAAGNQQAKTTAKKAPSKAGTHNPARQSNNTAVDNNFLPPSAAPILGAVGAGGLMPFPALPFGAPATAYPFMQNLLAQNNGAALNALANAMFQQQQQQQSHGAGMAASSAAAVQQQQRTFVNQMLAMVTGKTPQQQQQFIQPRPKMATGHAKGNGIKQQQHNNGSQQPTSSSSSGTTSRQQQNGTGKAVGAKADQPSSQKPTDAKSCSGTPKKAPMARSEQSKGNNSKSAGDRQNNNERGNNINTLNAGNGQNHSQQHQINLSPPQSIFGEHPANQQIATTAVRKATIPG